jgi:hypothetical protein
MDLKEMEGGGLAGWEGWGGVPPVRKLRVVARLLFFRPLKRAGVFWRFGNPSLATGATLCRPLTRAEGDSTPFTLRHAERFRNRL